MFNCAPTHSIQKRLFGFICILSILSKNASASRYSPREERDTSDHDASQTSTAVNSDGAKRFDSYEDVSAQVHRGMNILTMMIDSDAGRNESTVSSPTCTPSHEKLPKEAKATKNIFAPSMVSVAPSKSPSPSSQSMIVAPSKSPSPSSQVAKGKGSKKEGTAIKNKCVEKLGNSTNHTHKAVGDFTMSKSHKEKSNKHTAPPSMSNAPSTSSRPTLSPLSETIDQTDVFNNTNVTSLSDSVIGLIITDDGSSGLGQDGAAAFDGNTSTVWTSQSQRPTLTLIFPENSSYYVPLYSVTSAPDNNLPDPKSWVISGSNDKGDTWTELDNVSDFNFGERGERVQFTMDAPGTYNAYLFVITETSEVTGTTATETVQIAEIEFFGNEAEMIEAAALTTSAASRRLDGTYLMVALSVSMFALTSCFV